MFSDKNYGIPKDLIEAAKRVHEKQLEENLDKSIKKPENKDPDFTKFSKEIKPAFERIENQRKKDLKSEEVQFTEEELAEAFAIFLEENFHVDMLTEEDLDYVFEEEFPQWLEEQMTNQDWLEYALNERSLSPFSQREQLKKMGLGIKNGGIVDITGGKNSIRDLARRNIKQNIARKRETYVDDVINTPRGRKMGLSTFDSGPKYATRKEDGTPLKSKQKSKQSGYEGDLTGANKIAKQKATATAVQSDTGGPGETGVGDKIAKTPPAPRNQVSAKPAATARKVRSRSSGGSKLGRELMKIGTKVRATTATAAGRRKIALLDKYKRPKKNNWRQRAFNPDGN